MRLAMVAMRSHNALYRAFNPALALTARGHDIRYGTQDQLEHPAVLADFDAVLFYRVYNERAWRVARWLRTRGIAVVWDNDDLMHGVEREHTNYKRVGGLRGERIFADIREMLQAAHVVTTPSPVLAELYERVGASRTHVIENYLPVGYGIIDRQERQGVTIGWVAAMEHKTDADRLSIREALQRLLDAHPDVRVATVGISLGLHAAGDRYEPIRFIPFARLAAAVARFDIGIAPLTQSAFNASRSNVKLKEYAGVGVPWLASPIGPYQGLGEAQGGRLVADNRWFEELDRLVRNEGERRKLSKRGLKWARTQTIAENIERWEASFTEAIRLARSEARGSQEVRAGAHRSAWQRRTA